MLLYSPSTCSLCSLLFFLSHPYPSLLSPPSFPLPPFPLSRDSKPEEIAGSNAGSDDTVSPPSISLSHSQPSTSHFLARRMTAPSRPTAPPRKHPGVPPPSKSTLPPQKPPPNQTKVGNESPKSSTSPVREKVEQKTEVQDKSNQLSPRKSPPRPQKPLREQPSKTEMEESQKGWF